MKKKVADFIKSLGAKTAYSGKNRTMYIKVQKKSGKGKFDVEDSVLEKFGMGLFFRLETQWA